MGINEEIKIIMAGILNVDSSEIEDDSAIGDIPTWDSLNHLRIIAAIEEKYSIRFTPDVLMDLEDFSDIVQAVKDIVKI